jgi:hypothetical protein
MRKSAIRDLRIALLSASALFVLFQQRLECVSDKQGPLAKNILWLLENWKAECVSQISNGCTAAHTNGNEEITILGSLTTKDDSITHASVTTTVLTMARVLTAARSLTTVRVLTIARTY